MSASWSLNIGGRRSVAGLSWVPLIGETKREISSEVTKELARRSETHGVVHHPEGSRYAYVGIPRAEAGRKYRRASGAVPAALWFAAAAPKATVFVGDAAEGTWILVTSAVAGELDARTDVVVSRGKAVAVVADLVQELVAGGETPLVIVDPLAQFDTASLSGFVNVERKGLEAILDEHSCKDRVRKLRGVPAWVPWLAIAAVLGVVGYVGVQKVRDAAAVRAEKVMAERVVAHAAALEAVRANREPESVRLSAQESLDALLLAPPAVAAATACLNEANALPMRMGGWVRHELTCDVAGTQMATYRINPAVPARQANEATLQAAAAARGLGVSFEWFQPTATITRQFQAPAPRSAVLIASLPTNKDVGVAFSARARQVMSKFPGTQITFTAPQATTQAGKHTSAETLAADFLVGKVLISGREPRALFEFLQAENFIAIDSVVIAKPNVNHARAEWRATGKFITRDN